MRSSEYNVEILKNKLEQVNEEQMLLQRLSEKQQTHLSAVRSLNQRLRHDIEYLRKGKKPPKQPKLDLNSSAFVDMSVLSRYSVDAGATPFTPVQESETQTDLQS